jgi:hypothetical protein
MITTPDHRDARIISLQREAEVHRDARKLLANDLVSLAKSGEVVTALTAAVESRMKAGELALKSCAAFLEKWHR